MKTTIDVRDDVLRRAKARAALRGEPLSRFIEVSLERALRDELFVMGGLGAESPACPFEIHRGTERNAARCRLPADRSRDVAVILDTNALSSLAGKDARLVARLRNARRVVVTIISLGEFTYGIRQSRSVTDLEAWLKAFLMRAGVLRLDLRTIDQYAAVRTELRKAGTPIPANDCWIAALARQHRLPIVSLEEHFDVVDQVRRIAW